MFKKKARPVKPTQKIVRHFIFVEAPIEVIGPEVMQWGEAVWWPKEMPLGFTRVSAGDLAVGSVYKQKIGKGRLSLSVEVEVTKFESNTLMQRTFKKGILKGYEVIRVGERSNGTRVDYERHDDIVSPMNKILWAVFYQKHYDATIELALRKLKDHAVRKYQGQDEADPHPTEGA